MLGIHEEKNRRSSHLTSKAVMMSDKWSSMAPKDGDENLKTII